MGKPGGGNLPGERTPARTIYPARERGARQARHAGRAQAGTQGAAAAGGASPQEQPRPQERMGMQTFWASGGHPATQPMGAPGRGTPRGGGGVRRGRRRDVSFSRFPSITCPKLVFSEKNRSFSAQNSLKSAKIELKRSVVDACTN